MFTGQEIVETFQSLGITHVIWVPDTTLGRWEPDLLAAPKLRLLRVCREGEAWPLAAGLHVGGQRPIILMQTTGLFESGDALRNVLFDLRLPLFALIGARNWLHPHSPDTARRFTQPILDAWGIDRRWITRPEEKPTLGEHYRRCQDAVLPGFVVLAEE